VMLRVAAILLRVPTRLREISAIVSGAGAG
jgi:hypothetical protein